MFASVGNFWQFSLIGRNERHKINAPPKNVSPVLVFDGLPQFGAPEIDATAADGGSFTGTTPL
jgi:hypothetical protein